MPATNSGTRRNRTSGTGGGTVTEALSPQEFYLAQQLRDGRSYEEIADKLYVSRSRVNRVVESIYAKLGIHGKSRLGDYVW